MKKAIFTLAVYAVSRGLWIMRKSILVALSLLLFSTNAAGDINPLILVAQCDFTQGVTANWDNGSLKIKPSNFGSNGKITYAVFKDFSATATTKEGVDEGRFSLPPAGLTLDFDSLAVHTTVTIFSDRRPTRSGKNPAVISRHLEFMGAFPSQHYGECSVTWKDKEN